MKKILLSLFFILIVNHVFSFYSKFNLESGYSSNVYEDVSKESSFFMFGNFIIKKPILLSASFILFIDGDLTAKKYFKVSDEDIMSVKPEIKLRWKGEEQVLDVSFGSYYENLWNNSEYTFLHYWASPEYRKDFNTASLHIGALFGNYYMPNYDFDRYYYKPYVEGIIDLSWKHQINLRVSYKDEFFTEKYVLNNSFQNTDEAMRRQIFNLFFKWEGALTPEFSLFAKAEYEQHFSNANYYFYGPEEEDLIIDGDEDLFDDYYSKKVIDVKLGFLWNINNFKIKMEGGFVQTQYEKRYPLNSNGGPIKNEKMEITSYSIQSNIKYYLSESSYLNPLISYENKSSNDYYEETDIIILSLSIGLIF